MGEVTPGGPDKLATLRADIVARAPLTDSAVVVPVEMVPASTDGLPDRYQPLTEIPGGWEGSNGSLFIPGRDGRPTMVRMSKWD